MATNILRGSSWQAREKPYSLLRQQASQRCRRRLQRATTFAAVYNSELNVTTLQQFHQEHPTDGSRFGPCEWKANENKSSTHPNRFGKTYAQMKQAITAAPPMNDNEKRILLAIAMQESDNMDSRETVSIYNLNKEMLSLASFNGPYSQWDADTTALYHLAEANACILQFLRGSSQATRLPANANFGWSNAEAAINIVRGGIGAWTPCYNQSGYHNTGCYEEHKWIIDIYRRAIATSVKCMEDDPSIMTNNVRIVIDCPHY